MCVYRRQQPYECLQPDEQILSLGKLVATVQGNKCLWLWASECCLKASWIAMNKACTWLLQRVRVIQRKMAYRVARAESKYRKNARVGRGMRSNRLLLWVKVWAIFGRIFVVHQLLCQFAGWLKLHLSFLSLPRLRLSTSEHSLILPLQQASQFQIHSIDMDRDLVFDSLDIDLVFKVLKNTVFSTWHRIRSAFISKNLNANLLLQVHSSSSSSPFSTSSKVQRQPTR